VFAARPWGTFKWKKLERELQTLARSRAPGTGALHASLVARRAAALEALPGIVERLGRRARQLASKVPAERLKGVVGAEPNAPLLFAALKGTLTPESALAHLQTMEAVEGC